jgi:hypothetical protein
MFKRLTMIPLSVLVLSTLVFAQEAAAPQVPGAIQSHHLIHAEKLSKISFDLTSVVQ